MSFSEISIRNVCLDHQPVTFSYLANCFISNEIYPFLAPSPKITSGEISAKGSREAHRQSGGWANKQQRASQVRIHQSSQHIKNKFNRFKSILQKSEATYRQSQPVNTPINHLSPHPEERIWAGRTPRRQPRVPDAPKIKRDEMKQFYIVDIGRKMWYYRLIKKSANPSRLRRKNLSRNEKLNDTTNENRLCRRLADTRDLKSLSGNRVRVRPLPTTREISK